jgi:DNA-directed RNA polymerase specialized sigma subunit
MSRRGNQWEAKVVGKAGLSACGHNTRTARRLIADLIRTQFGDVDFHVGIVLSENLQSQVRKYRDDEKLLRRLAVSVPESRARWIEALLAINLSQSEVAEVLGLTRSHVAVTLKRATTRRTRRAAAT